MENKEIDILKDITEYHENVLLYEREIRKLATSFSKDAASVAWKKYYEFYKTEIDEHFLFEEKVVFPVILAVRDDAQTSAFITSLKKTASGNKKVGILNF